MMAMIVDKSYGVRSRGFSLVEMIVSIAIIALLLALILPAIQQARSSARKMGCFNNLRQIGLALQNYESQHKVLPPFNVWSGPPGEPLKKGKTIGVFDRVAMGLAPDSEPDRTHANWLVMLLPYMDQAAVYQQYDSLSPVSSEANQAVRTTELELLKCPHDTFSRPGKYYQRDFVAGTDRNRYARGNYGMNIGPVSCLVGVKDCIEGYVVDDIDLQHKTMTLIGSGIGGFNVSIKMADVTIGASNMVAVDELRAGIHEGDPRGTWALGFVGASATSMHGEFVGDMDAGGPNNQHKQSDDIVGCRKMQEAVGFDKVAELGMPCLMVKTETNSQATSRSMHPGGVNVLMLDGSAHFISDTVNLDVWKNMHKRNSKEKFTLPF